MIILLIAAIAAAAAMAQVVFKGDVGGGRVVAVLADVVGGDVGVWPVAVLIVDALGLACVDVGVVPEREGGVRGYGIVRVVVVANGGEAFIVVFFGAIVEGEDL